MTHTLNWNRTGWQKGDRKNQAHAMGGYFHITTFMGVENEYDICFNWIEKCGGEHQYRSIDLGKSSSMRGAQRMAAHFLQREVTYHSRYCNQGEYENSCKGGCSYCPELNMA